MVCLPHAQCSITVIVKLSKYFLREGTNIGARIAQIWGVQMQRSARMAYAPAALHEPQGLGRGVQEEVPLAEEVPVAEEDPL